MGRNAAGRYYFILNGLERVTNGQGWTESGRIGFHIFLICYFKDGASSVEPHGEKSGIFIH